MKAYQQVIEAELKKHFETNPVLKKIRSGEPVSDREIDVLVSLILTQNPDVRRENLEEFFSETAVPLYLAIRTIIGMDPEAVRDKFASFVQKHPKLSAKQTRFLALLQNHIARYGTIEVERLYDAPFTVIDADGPDGVFENEVDLTDLIRIVRSFGFTADERSDDNPNERK
jgi:type I restriction enzyme R subunit